MHAGVSGIFAFDIRSNVIEGSYLMLSLPPSLHQLPPALSLSLPPSLPLPCSLTRSFAHAHTCI